MNSYTLNEPFICKYQPNPHHRNSSRKSKHTQWNTSINENSEFQIFEEATSNGWGSEITSFWGIRIDQNTILETLNNPALHNNRIAKWCRFVCSNTTNIWHGFPQWPDPSREHPPQSILISWSIYRPLSKAKVTKILRGRRCEF
jgi:hypothetical protein